MKLTLGPVFFNWPPDVWRDFYFRIADEAPLDTVVVGEVVCSKRMPFFAATMPEVIDRLERSGKEVVLGSLALVTLKRERRHIDQLVANGERQIEVNDLSCLAGVAGLPHSIGPFMQVYNEATAGYLAQLGATRICLPPELPADAISAICRALPSVAIEVFGFGRMPLAISARCYHARAAGYAKENCRFVCESDMDGLAVTTLDGTPFVAINGVHTMSHACANLAWDLKALETIGVAALRISPQSCDMVAIARLFREMLDDQVDVAQGAERIGQLFPSVPFSNGFLHGEAGLRLLADGRPAA